MSTAAECAALKLEVSRLKAINAALAAAIQHPLDSRQLHDFLDAAAGEGLVLAGIDAADLYALVFAVDYAKRIEGT